MSGLAGHTRVSPFLWFDGKADEAVNLYCSVFPNSRRLEETRTGRSGEVLIVSFELDGLKFTALNGGPMFTFNEAVSFVVRCETQEEIDYYWSALTADGGKPGQCGWLKDRFGLSWQVVPAEIGDFAQSPAAMQALMGMTKLDLGALRRAVEEEQAPA